MELCLTWIEERLADRKLRQERAALIRSHAGALYDALWAAIMEHVEEGKKKGLPLFTNGAVHRRIVRLSVNSLPHEAGRAADEFILALAEDKRSISARG